MASPPPFLGHESRGQIQRMTRVFTLRAPEAPHHCMTLNGSDRHLLLLDEARLPPMRTTPGGDDPFSALRLSLDDVEVAVADRLLAFPKRLWICRAQGEEIADCKVPKSPPFGVVDAPGDGRVVENLVGTGRVKHDTKNAPLFVSPPPAQAVATGARLVELGGADHARTLEHSHICANTLMISASMVPAKLPAVPSSTRCTVSRADRMTAAFGFGEES